jgi:hypothetical protein
MISESGADKLREPTIVGLVAPVVVTDAVIAVPGHKKTTAVPSTTPDEVLHRIIEEAQRDE